MSIIKRARSKSKPKFYVYFNDWTGEIISVGRSKRNSPATCIVTDDAIAEQIVDGDANVSDYLVSSDRNRNERIVAKSDVLQLRKQEDSLFLLPEGRIKDWEIRARLFRHNMMFVVETNRKMLSRLIGHNRRQEIHLEKSATFDFYIIRRDHPDYLIKTVSIDAETLVNQPRVAVDVQDIVKYVTLDQISVMTRRYFEKYYFDSLYDRYVDPDNVKHSPQFLKWQWADQWPEYHLEAVQHGNLVTFTSAVSAEQLTDIGFTKRYKSFYVVGETPDQLIGKFMLDVERLRTGQPQKFKVDFNIMHVNIMFGGSQIKLNKRAV